MRRSTDITRNPLGSDSPTGEPEPELSLDQRVKGGRQASDVDEAIADIYAAVENLRTRV